MCRPTSGRHGHHKDSDLKDPLVLMLSGSSLMLAASIVDKGWRDTNDPANVAP